MKKYFIVFFIIMGIFLLTGCNNKNDTLKSREGVELIPNSYHVYFEGECNHLNELYFEDNNYTYYKICIDYIGLDFKNTKLYRTLDDAILRKETSLDNLINKSNEQIQYGLYDVYLFDDFNLAIKDKNIYLINKIVNYEEYLDDFEN